MGARRARPQRRKVPAVNEQQTTSVRIYAAGNVTPVGLYPHGATPEGIEDLAGNVWEWVADRYADYGKSPRGIREVPNPVRGGVARGRLERLSSTCASANRDWNAPAYRYVNFGFRWSRKYLP